MMISLFLMITITFFAPLLEATDTPPDIITCTDTIVVKTTDVNCLRYPYRPDRIGYLVINGVRSTKPSLLFSYKHNEQYDGTFSPKRTTSLRKEELGNNVLFRLCMYAGRLYFESICKRYVLEIMDSGEFTTTDTALERRLLIYYFDTIEQFKLIDTAIKRCAQEIKKIGRESCEIYIGSTCYSITQDTKHKTSYEDKPHERFYAVKHLPGNRVAPEAIQLAHLLLTEWVTQRRPSIEKLFLKPMCCTIS
jgi:hypothetical protein